MWVACRAAPRPSGMNPVESYRMAQRYAASDEAFERLAQIMSTEVSIPVSDRYNAKYGERDLHQSLIALSISNAYAESGMKGLAMKAASADIPSGSWVRDTVGRVPEKEMEERLERALSSTLDQVRAFGAFSTPVMAALDKHRLPRYDEGMEPFLRRSRKDRGTNKFEFYASLQSVEEGRRAQIACEQFGFFDENDTEFILIQRKPGPYRKPSVEQRRLSYIPRRYYEVWFRQIWDDIRGDSTREHPAPFPIALAERLIRMYSFVGDVVLDPMVGRGTTMLAAAKCGRNSCGYEIDPAFARVARVKIEQECSSLIGKREFEFHVSRGYPSQPLADFLTQRAVLATP